MYVVIQKIIDHQLAIYIKLRNWRNARHNDAIILQLNQREATEFN